MSGGEFAAPGNWVQLQEGIDNDSPELFYEDLMLSLIHIFRERADAPSLVAEKQTLLEAAVSYLLRQCALEGRVMMGERQGNQP